MPQLPRIVLPATLLVASTAASYGASSSRSRFSGSAENALMS